MNGSYFVDTKILMYELARLLLAGGRVVVVRMTNPLRAGA